MNLLSIQSHVAYGHVGNSAAVFPLQRLGVEVWPVHTVQFSNHTGYGETRGSVFDARLIRDVVAGIEKRGVLEKCDGVLSGYIGGVDIGEAILDAVAKLKRANPGALYCCDPVIGNAERGVFVREGVAEFIRDKAVPTADIVTPNQFELNQITGRASGTLAAARDAVKAVHDHGPRVVLVTSLCMDDTPQDAIDLLASDNSGQFRLRTPRLAAASNPTLRQADAEIGAGEYRGVLHGIPWGGKDLLDTAGIRTTYGAEPYHDRVPKDDAAVVKRLNAAGAVLIAKLSLGALALNDIWFGGQTMNPWLLEEGASGSSAGPGAATAAGLVGFAIGSETGGSIVAPSMRCGVTGLRPTYGRVSRYGAMALAYSMDKIGPMARSADRSTSAPGRSPAFMQATR